MNTPLVSVIIPFYNSEKFLPRCIESLLGQSLSNIEFIFVDDFSEDNSLSVAMGYAAKDLRIKVIRNKSNLKQGAARNNGIHHASGEYIGFVDSDDWVDLDYFEKLYNSAKKYNSDIALATNVRIGNGKTKKRLNIKEEEFKTELQDKFDICNLSKNPCPTNKIYRTSFLKQHNILYPENCYCEDKLFVTKAVYYSNGIVSTPNTNYYYFRNPNSTVNSKSKKHTKQLIKDKNNARLSVLNFLKEQKANIRDKEFWATTKEIKLFNFPLLTKKESLHTTIWCLFGIIRVFGCACLLRGGETK